VEENRSHGLNKNPCTGGLHLTRAKKNKINGGQQMPIYEFICQECKNIFE
jgi:hypothetical protein